MPITALPIAPNRQDPATFSSRADAWVGALDTFTTEANALQTDVNAKQVTASNAATTATNAVQAINSALNRYTFSTTTTMADPGVGVIRFNNTTASSATEIAIDDQSADTGNPNILNLLLSFGDSTNNPKGLIRFTQAGTPANYRAYNVTAVTNNTGWVQLTVLHVGGAGSFSNGASLVMEFHRAGDAGDVQLSANNTFTGNNTFNNSTAVSANSSSDALRITQTGEGNALVVEDSTSPDISPFVIDNNGNVIAGNTSPIVFSGAFSPRVQSAASNSTLSPGFASVTAVNASSPVRMVLAKSRGTLVSAPEIVANNDQVGEIRFDGHDGAGYALAGTITAAIDGTPSVGSMPGRLIFSTTPGGSSTPVERLRIDSDGRVSVVSGFTIGRTAVTSPVASDGNVFSGTYTPTLFNTTNVASSTPAVLQYMRVGNTVTVSGQVTIAPTATGNTVLGMSLPITSSLTSTAQVGGTAISQTTTQVAAIYADTTNNRATIRLQAAAAATIVYSFQFTYRVA